MQLQVMPVHEWPKILCDPPPPYKILDPRPMSDQNVVNEDFLARYRRKHHSRHRDGDVWSGTNQRVSVNKAMTRTLALPSPPVANLDTLQVVVEHEAIPCPGVSKSTVEKYRLPHFRRRVPLHESQSQL